MRLTNALTLVALLAALAPSLAFAQGVAFSGGDGSSFATAIVIEGAKNEMEGIGAERTYVASRHKDWREENSALITKGDRSYDINEYRAADGSKHTLTFDVTGFLGKL
jgi:hypothetical protein